MRVNVNLTNKDGSAVSNSGWVNVFSNETTGRLTTGSRTYYSKAAADEGCVVPDGCIREGAVLLVDYMNDETTNAAKEAAIEAFDLRLGKLLGIKLYKV